MLQEGASGRGLAPDTDTYNYTETRGPNSGVADMWMFTLKSCCQTVAKQCAPGELPPERKLLAALVRRLVENKFCRRW